MSFSILLQQNKSENNKLDKDVSTILELTGTLKSETSIIDPIILIECDITAIANCNYMTISTFNRKYFVSNIKSVRNNIVEISAHVDVLSSFESYIKECTGIVKRQENSWNLYLNDGSFKIYQNPNVLTKEFPSGFNTQEFVLAVAGS